MKQLPVGATAPDFTLQALNGQVFRLSEQIQDRPVVLAFFKVSCPTCQFTFPYLQKIYGHHPATLRASSRLTQERGSSFRICGISQDEIDETQAFAEKFGIKFEILIDEHPYAVSAAYGFEYVPAIFVVGGDGKIRLSDYGFSKATLSEIAKPQQLFTADDGIPATRPG